MSRIDYRAADPARAAANLHDSPAAKAVAHDLLPDAALALLPALRREAGRDLHLWRFLASSPQFCAALMLHGAALLAWDTASANAPLGEQFVWATAVLIGIAAVARNHVRGFSRTPIAVPLAESAGELRLLLLYTGFVWGLGAFLLLPPASGPTLALAFAAGPGLLAAIILKDEMGAIGFGAPVTLLTAAAVSWNGRPQGAWTGAAILIAGAMIAGLAMLQCAILRRRPPDLH